MAQVVATASITATAGNIENAVIYYLAYCAILVLFSALWAVVITVSYNDLRMAEIKAGIDSDVAVTD